MKFLIALLLLATSVCCESIQKQKIVATNNTTPQKNDPKLTSPKVRKVWIPDKIESDKYIEGHWMWVLESTSSWSQ